MNIDLWTWDVGAQAPTPAACLRLFLDKLNRSWEEEADIVLFPEYAWMCLERFVAQEDKLAGVADLFWRTLWPRIQEEVESTGRLIVLGTVPWLDPDGTMRNRAPILCDGGPAYQDKLCLTPWETGFCGGTEIRLLSFGPLTVAVVICLDIEVPELSALLRGRGVDLILVPSATESTMGVDRIGRCASARAIELGCHVGVAHLVGKTLSELVDENLGRLAWFSPSQLPFANANREDCSPLVPEGFVRKRVHLDRSLLVRMRSRRLETNPALLTLPSTPVTIAGPSAG